MQQFIMADFEQATLQALKVYLDNGGRNLTLAASAPKGKLPFALPDDALIADLRYGGTSFIRGNHPRIEGYWTQYSNLSTGLARNVTFSQTLTDETPVENWRSEPYEMQDAPLGQMSVEVYRDAHNHHQLVHAEISNFSKDLNGVAIWGDSGAFAPGAKGWGAFFSARSYPVKWLGYTPEKLFHYDEKTEFDAGLIGIEVDVLNNGLPWDQKMPGAAHAYAKVGVQIVGFGKRNTAAIEIRTEDSDDPTRGPDTRRGAWHWGIIMRNSLDSESTVMLSANGHILRGIDFDLTTFKEGAIRIAGAGANSGIIFDGGTSGEIYSVDATTHLRIGERGLKIWNSDGTELLLEMTTYGVRIHKPNKWFGRLIRTLRRRIWRLNRAP